MKIFDVKLPYSEIQSRKERLDHAYRFEKADRVPVLAPFHSRYYLEKLDIPARDYFFDPEIQLKTQCWGKAWVLNHIQTDFTELAVGVDMGHYYESWALGCELDFDEYTPWIKSHPVREEIDLKTLAEIDINDNPMTIHEESMRKRMGELAADYALRFEDGKVVFPAENIKPPNGTVGLFTLAADLRGPQIYLDTVEDPELVERLMEIVTDQVIERLEHVRREHGYPFADSYICDDASAQLSAAAYRRFVLPYNRRLKEHFGGKLTLHCCGRANHLVPIWADELGVDILWNFSYETERSIVAHCMGGRTVLVGNVNWKLINAGTPDEVFADACDTLDAFSAFEGHILSSPNIPPSVTPENLNAMVRASQLRAVGEG